MTLTWLDTLERRRADAAKPRDVPPSDTPPDPTPEPDPASPTTSGSPEVSSLVAALEARLGADALREVLDHLGQGVSVRLPAAPGAAESPQTADHPAGTLLGGDTGAERPEAG